MLKSRIIYRGVARYIKGKIKEPLIIAHFREYFTTDIHDSTLQSYDQLLLFIKIR
jgi:hypothetical protein